MFFILLQQMSDILSFRVKLNVKLELLLMQTKLMERCEQSCSHHAYGVKNKLNAWKEQKGDSL